MKKRCPPQGTYAHAQLRTRPTSPPDEEKIPSSMYLRSRPTTYTPWRTTRRRKDPSLKVATLTPYYVHALADHQKKKRAQPQGSYAHALLRTCPTGPPKETKNPSLKAPTLTPYYTHTLQDFQIKGPLLKVPTLTPYYVHALQEHQTRKKSPRGTCVHALLRTRPTRPPHEEKSLS